MGVKLACNAFCFPYDDFAENAAAVAAAGYEGIEPNLTAEMLANSDAVEAIARIAERHDLAIPSVLGGDFWGSPISSADEDTREAGIASGRDLIEAAGRLGAETVLVVPGKVTERTPYDVAYDNALASMRELAPIAAQNDVTLGVENVWNRLLYSPIEFAAFVDAAAEAGPVGAYFDVGNVARFGYPDQWIRHLDTRIVAIHVKDYDDAVGTIDAFTYPLAGSIDWEAVAVALDEIGYDGWITPEVPPYASFPERALSNMRADLAAIFE